MRHHVMGRGTLACVAISLLVPLGTAFSQATRMRPASDTLRATALNLSVISRASWFEQTSVNGTPRTFATDFVAAPSMRFRGGRVGVSLISAFTPLGVEENAPAWTNAVGLDVQRGSLSMSLSVGQDVGYRTHRRIIVEPALVAPDTLDPFVRDSLSKGIQRPVSPEQRAGDTTTQTSSRAVLVGASTAALQWTGSRVSARAYYGLVLGNTGSRRPLGGADVHVALGATALMFALEQRIAPSEPQAAGGGFAAHVGLRFDAMPWSRRTPTRPVEQSPSFTEQANSGTRFVAEHTERGIRLRMRVPGAGQVEIAGNLTSWESISMTPDAGGWWHVVLPGEKGLHRLRVRVDGGAWTAPAGVAATRDEFGEPVGMVVVH